MPSRNESAASTRRALLDAATELLDAGGPEAVTMREVGSRAGVSRNAPYRHFADKEALLSEIAVQSWGRLTAALQASNTRSASSATRLHQALMEFVELGRTRSHLYQLMFTIPARNRDAGAHAAARAQEEFLSIVAAVVGQTDAQRYGALLLSTAHGIVSLEISQHLTEVKWNTTAEELIRTLTAMTPQTRRAEATA